MLLIVRSTGLVSDIDGRLHLLKRHLPYHESDHMLNITFNIMARGHRLEHLELRRNDDVYLNALGAERIPDPTMAGDFCQRFSRADVLELMDAINKAQVRVWKQQPQEFFEEAIIDADGTIVGTDAACKEGVELVSNGVWGYHPLVVSLANTQELLFLVNRAGSRPSHEITASFIDPSPCADELASARSSYGVTPISPRRSSSTAGATPGTFTSSFALIPGPTKSPWPRNCRSRHSVTWNVAKL
jgi:hypothetical protein